jgi:hypothetical protein
VLALYCDEEQIEIKVAAAANPNELLPPCRLADDGRVERLQRIVYAICVDGQTSQLFAFDLPHEQRNGAGRAAGAKADRGRLAARRAGARVCFGHVDHAGGICAGGVCAGGVCAGGVCAGGVCAGGVCTGGVCAGGALSRALGQAGLCEGL